MAATITTTLKDNSKEWAANLKKQLDSAGISAADAGVKLEDVGKALKSKEAADYAAKVKDVVAELERASPAAKQLESNFNATTGAIIQQRSALRQMSDSAQDAAQNAGKLDDYIKDLNAAVDAQRLTKYRKELDALADATVNGAKKAGGMGQQWTELNAKLGVVNQALGMARGAFQSVSSVVSALAAAGVPAFTKLEAATAQWQKKLIAIAADPDIQRAVTFYSKELGKSLEPSGIIGSTASFGARAAKGITGAATDALAYLGEKAGILSKGTIAVNTAANEREAKQWKIEREKMQRDEIKRQQDQAKQEAEALENFSDPGKKMREDAERQERNGKMITSRLVEMEIERQKAVQAVRVKDLKANEKDPTKDRDAVEGQKNLVELEQRRLELIKQEEEIEKTRGQEQFDTAIAKLDMEKAREARTKFEEQQKQYELEKGIIGQIQKDKVTLEREQREYNELLEKATKEEDKYLATLKGPIKEEEEERIKREREFRKLEQERVEEELKAVELLKAKKAEAAAAEKKAAQDKFDKIVELLKAQQGGGGGGGQQPQSVQAMLGGGGQQPMQQPQGGGGGGGGNGGGGGGGFEQGGVGFDQGGGGGFDFDPTEMQQMLEFQQRIQFIKTREEKALNDWKKQQKQAGTVTSVNTGTDEKPKLEDLDKFKKTANGNFQIKNGQRVAFGSSKGELQAQRAQTKRSSSATRKDARKQAGKDFSKGNVKQSDLANAQNNANTALSDYAKKSGDFNQEQLDFIDKLVDKYNELNTKNAELNDKLNDIQNKFNGGGGGGGGFGGGLNQAQASSSEAGSSSKAQAMS